MNAYILLMMLVIMTDDAHDFYWPNLSDARIKKTKIILCVMNVDNSLFPCIFWRSGYKRSASYGFIFVNFTIHRFNSLQYVFRSKGKKISKYLEMNRNTHYPGIHQTVFVYQRDHFPTTPRNLQGVERFLSLVNK